MRRRLQPRDPPLSTEHRRLRRPHRLRCELVRGGGGERRSAESCTIVSRTLETAIEAPLAQNQYDITAAEELVSGGYLIELDADSAIDFSSDVPTPTPVPAGSCDYDFESPLDTDRSDWADRQCWLDQIAIETSVRGYIAHTGHPPESFAEIASVYPAFSDSWPSVELGPDAASDAFFAQFERHRASIDELVEVEFLRESPDGWSLTVSESDGVAIEPLPGGRCDLAE